MEEKRHYNPSHGKDGKEYDGGENAGAVALACAVASTAADDYRAARSALAVDPDCELAKRVCFECRRFFLSWWFTLLSHGASGEYVMRHLDAEPTDPKMTPDRIHYLASYYPPEKEDKKSEPKLTPEERAALEKMRVESESIRKRIADGETFKSIGASYGISGVRVSRFAKENNLVEEKKKAESAPDSKTKPRPEPMSKAEIEMHTLLDNMNNIRVQLQKDKPVKVIADMYHVDYTRMKRFIAKYNLNKE